MNRNILILGASGFLGGHLVRAVQSAGHRLTIGVRDPERLDRDLPTARILVGDLADSEYIRSAIAGQDAIFFAAGRTWSPGLDPAEYRHSNVTITRQFFRVLRGRRGVRILFTNACQTSQVLRESLRQLLASSRYDRRLARYHWPRSCGADIKRLQQFLAHAYYSSRDFLQEVQ